MGPSPYRTTRTTLMFAVLLGAVALLGSQRATAGGADMTQSDFAGLVDIGGGRRLYLECRGTGSPTVVLEGGARSSARYWTDDLRRPQTPRTMVLPAVAGFTRVCAYDRPGTYAATDEDPDDVHISRSDPIPQPRTAPAAAADLHALLQAAGVPGPYVIAGHSIGGMLARFYASTFPEEVVGLVLVDSYSERLEFHMTPEQWQGLVQLNAELGVDEIIPIPGYGDAETFAYGANDAVMREAAAASPLRPMPLAVLAHGVPFEIPTPPEGFASGDELEAVLQAAQADLATLVPNARFTVADKSGHDVHQDQPELVIEAIRQVVEGVRHPDTWYDLVTCCAAASATAALTTAPGQPPRSSGLRPIDPAALQATVETAIREMIVPGAMVLLRTPQGEVTVSAGTTELGATINDIMVKVLDQIYVDSPLAPSASPTDTP